MRLLLTGASGFIGTNLIEDLSGGDVEILNLDTSPPLKPGLKRFWKESDIMNPEQLPQEFSEFKPTHVIHMAARTDCDENTPVQDGYQVNTQGTRNVIDAIKSTPSIERDIMPSRQIAAMFKATGAVLIFPISALTSSFRIL